MASLMDKYKVPEINFGVEYEFDFAVLKDVHNKYVQDGDGKNEAEEIEMLLVRQFGTKWTAKDKAMLKAARALRAKVDNLPPTEQVAQLLILEYGVEPTDEKLASFMQMLKKGGAGAKANPFGLDLSAEELAVFKSVVKDKNLDQKESENSGDSFKSQAEQNCYSIQRYVRDLLNHDLPHSPPRETAFVAPGTCLAYCFCYRQLIQEIDHI